MRPQALKRWAPWLLLSCCMATDQFEYRDRLVTVETWRTAGGYAWSWRIDNGHDHVMRTGVPSFATEMAAASAAQHHARHVIDHLERLKADSNEGFNSNHAASRSAWRSQ